MLKFVDFLEKQEKQKDIQVNVKTFRVNLILGCFQWICSNKTQGRITEIFEYYSKIEIKDWLLTTRNRWAEKIQGKMLLSHKLAGTWKFRVKWELCNIVEGAKWL